MKKNRIGIINIHGLPASHGAFEQTTEQLINHLPHIDFIVNCKVECMKFNYQKKNVKRIFTTRFPMVGIILFGLIGFFKMYFFYGVRSYIFFGYTHAPFFGLFDFLNCKIICNVDGFEWKRRKWGYFAKIYFKICEKLAALSKATLIYDSNVISRYYSLIHHREGYEIFYGSEILTNKYPLKLSEKFFCVVMRLEPENNIDMILKGFTESDSEYKLYIIGPRTKYFDQLWNNYKNNKKIKYLGPIYNRDKLMAIRKKAVAYIHGHSVGGTNPTLVEACYLKKPIISFGTFFNKEVLKDKACYFKNSDSLKKILNNKYFIKPPSLDKRYKWKFIAKQYEKAIKN